MTAAHSAPPGHPLALGGELAELAGRIRRSTVRVAAGSGGGAGVVWDESGVVVTNAHVARGDRVRVELSDGRPYPGEVIARDDRRDLAALKIDAAGLEPLRRGDSDRLRVGELVLAVGNPLGHSGALTVGIVHAVRAPHAPLPRRRASPWRPWVQADVRLAPGNSGGPLADSAGRLVGINSMIAGGLALAVPVNAVKRFLERPGPRPRLGVELRPVLLEQAGERQLGLLVLGVSPGTPADRAGITIGDVLVGAAGWLFSRPDDLAFALADAVPGERLPLEVARGGRRATREVVLHAGRRGAA
jgi:serine protease Do